MAGVGGGEGGYALGFASLDLFASCMRGPGRMMPVSYDPRYHVIVVDRLVQQMVYFFERGRGKRGDLDLDRWIANFLNVWSQRATPMAVFFKHPSFSTEAEWRMIRGFTPDDVKRIIFRQRQTMMARHLPTDLGPHLPLAEVMVGPSRHQQVSQVAIADLLHSLDYDPLLATCSSVPLQTT